MSKKKMLSILFRFLVVGIFFAIGTQPVKASTEITTETTTEISTQAACVSPTLTYESKNTATKTLGFKATGTPGNMVSIKLTKYLTGTVAYGGFAYLNSSGVAYIELTVANGSYEAVLTQESPCSGSTPAIFVTMN